MPENKIKKMKNGHLAPGAYTPSMAFGADYVLDLEGTKLSRVKLQARYARRKSNGQQRNRYASSKTDLRSDACDGFRGANAPTATSHEGHALR